MNNGTKTVAIVGAGIVGVSTAIWLQRAGHDVILVDREGPAAGASFGNGGVLASCSIVPVTVPGLLSKIPKYLMNPGQPLFLKWSYLPRLLPWLIRYLKHGSIEAVTKRATALVNIIGDSLADHQALAEGTPAAKWIIPADYLYLYGDRNQFESDSFGWSMRKQHGVDWDIMEGKEFRAYDPIFGQSINFAVRLKDHGRISDPGQYVKDLCSHVQSSGGKFIQSEVTDFVLENRKVTGVRVDGDTIPCDSVVVATGAWSAKLAAKLGMKVPLETERGYHVELWEPSVMPKSPVMVASAKFVATPMEGRLRLAGIVEYGGLDAPPSQAPFNLLLNSIQSAIPGLNWRKKTEWMGHRPAMADSIPVIGEIPDAKGVFFGFGHDHVGLTGGPKTGRIISQLISGQKLNMDMSPYSPARFKPNAHT